MYEKPGIYHLFIFVYITVLMGCINSDISQTQLQEIDTNKNELIVATLNYCGIMNSPFEFYCDDYLEELKDISKEFIALLPTYFPQFDSKTFKFEMGKIDLKLRDRYSPMFILEAGIENNKFISRQRFQQKWLEKFNIEMPKLKIPYTQAERDVTRTYDLIMFHCLLRYVYKLADLKDAEKLSVNKYVQKLKPFYNLSFLDELKKSEKVMGSLGKVNADVFFFQEYSENFYEKVKKSQKYYIANDESKDTLILAKKTSFKSKPATKEIFMEKKNVTKELWDKLNCAERTAMMIIDNYILICAHLTSKAQKNGPQMIFLREGLQTLKKIVPDHDIILGGDLNSFWKKQEGDGLHVFPEEQEWTTIKKRTATQGQFHKANKVICQSKDKIIATLPIHDKIISYINGQKPNKQNLVPTNQHPFDHFVLVTHLEKRQSS